MKRPERKRRNRKMPIYEFECRKCSKKFETITPSGAQDGIECPYCGGSETQKLVSS